MVCEMIDVSTNIHLILIKLVLLSDERQDYQNRKCFLWSLAVDVQ